MTPNNTHNTQTVNDQNANQLNLDARNTLNTYIFDVQEMANLEGVALALPKNYTPNNVYQASKTLGEYMFNNMWR